MTITRVNGAGWGVGEKLTSAQANAIDLNLVKCVDGVGGGHYEPATSIQIDSTSGGALELVGPIPHIIGGTVQVDGTIIFDGTTLEGAGGALMDWDGDVDVTGSIDAVGSVTTNGDYLVSSRSVTRTNPLQALYDPALWNATISGYIVTTAAAAYTVALQLDLPQGSTLTGVTAHVKGGLVGVTLASPMPTLQVRKVAVATGVATDIGAVATDPSLTDTAYTAVHTITRSGLTEVIDRLTYIYLAVITAGGNASYVSADFRVYGAKAVCTVTTVDVGAG